MMISWPKHPGNDIDVNLNPLIEYLILFWEEGTDVDDVYSDEKIKMCATLFYTIIDFHVYGNLTGYSVKDIKCVL